MTKMTMGADPFLTGFDPIERKAGPGGRSQIEGYPPFNIEQTGEAHFRITLAVAGFSDDDLSITLENRNLVIRGRRPSEDEGRVYLYRGIAGRKFQKTFVLAEGVEVTGARTEDGLLHVDLERREPEVVVRRVDIRTS